MNFKRILMLALASVLCLCLLCTVACDQGEGEEQSTKAETNAPESTEATTEQTTEQVTEEVTTDDGKVTYTVKVVDANGAPVAGAAVQFCDDNGCRMPVATNAEGIVTLRDAESNFHVTLASVPEGFAADPTEYYFDGAFELTITLNAQ
jgi:maltose-binding protein MalE